MSCLFACLLVFFGVYGFVMVVVGFFFRQAQGEAAVKEEFPEATIVRPAKLFGNEDRLLQWMAEFGFKFGRLPLVSALSTTSAPGALHGGTGCVRGGRYTLLVCCDIC